MLSPCVASAVGVQSGNIETGAYENINKLSTGTVNRTSNLTNAEVTAIGAEIKKGATESDMFGNMNTLSSVTVNHTSNYTKVEPVALGPEVTTRSYAPLDSSESSSSMGEEMIKNAASGLILGFADMFVKGLGGVQTGQLDGTGASSEQVAIFAVVAHTIDPTTDPSTMDDIATVKQIYIYGMVLFALLLALFLLFQQLRPHSAAQIVETITGQYGFVAIDEMVEYYCVTCGWLFFGPMVFYSAIWVNNYLVQSLMLSILDLVTFNANNLMLYVTMVTLWVLLLCFFALRIVTILIVVRLWYLLGLAIAIKRIRWIGYLTILYMVGVVFFQFFLVWPAVTIVSYVSTHPMSGFGVEFLYLGLFILELVIALIVTFWPLILAVVSPNTLKNVMMVARYAA